jgi:hypothetical protein
MARNSGGKTSAPSRIRFIMVEAELGDGDIGQITQAIQNALRGPTTSSVKRFAMPIGANGATSEPEIEPEVEVVEESDVNDARPVPAKARSPRKPSSAPNVVDIDMSTDVSLASFAKGKDAKSQHKKFLIAAAWLKEHRSVPSVTADHIYTCFRSMEWSTSIPDFSQPLRDLKARKFFTKNDNGEYEINHIGLDFVKKLGGANGAD